MTWLLVWARARSGPQSPPPPPAAPALLTPYLSPLALSVKPQPVRYNPLFVGFRTPGVGGRQINVASFDDS